MSYIKINKEQIEGLSQDLDDKARKVTSISGIGYLQGGGTLEADRTIDLTTAAKTAISEGVEAKGWGDHRTPGYIGEAPIDGKIRGRKDGAWEEMPSSDNPTESSAMNRVYGDMNAQGTTLARKLVNPFLVNQIGVHNHRVTVTGNTNKSILENGALVISASQLHTNLATPDRVWQGKIFLQLTGSVGASGVTPKITFEAEPRSKLGSTISHELLIPSALSVASANIVVDFQVIFHGGSPSKWYTVVGSAMSSGSSDGSASMSIVEVKPSDVMIDTSTGIDFRVFFSGSKTSDSCIARNLSMWSADRLVIE